MQPRKSTTKRIPIESRRGIVDIAKELNISLSLEAVRNIVRLGMESPNQEAELEGNLKKLEEQKRRLTSDFQKIAFQSNQLESKYVGTRNQFGRISRDNRVLAMHLCARTFKGEREDRLRNEMIQKYIINYKSMQNQQDSNGGSNANVDCPESTATAAKRNIDTNLGG